MEGARLKTDQSFPDFISRDPTYFFAPQIVGAKGAYLKKADVITSILQKEEKCCDQATD